MASPPKWNTYAGTVMLLGFAQFLLLMVLSEALYPGYSPANNYISDLGVGSTAYLFNASAVLLGITAIAGAYFLYMGRNGKTYPVLQALVGIGAMGVGILPETTGMLHIASAGIAFGVGGIAAIYSSRLQGKSPLRYYSIVFGLIALGMLVLAGMGITFAIGKGGIERMIFYPIIIWGIAFSGYLLSSR